MKNILLVLFIGLISMISINVNGQINNIAEKPYSILDGNTLIGVGDYVVGFGYVTRKTNIDSLTAKLSEMGLGTPFLTPYGNLPTRDSVGIWHGLTLYEDSTVINNQLKIENDNWGALEIKGISESGYQRLQILYKDDKLGHFADSEVKTENQKFPNNNTFGNVSSIDNNGYIINQQHIIVDTTNLHNIAPNQSLLVERISGQDMDNYSDAVDLLSDNYRDIRLKSITVGQIGNHLVEYYIDSTKFNNDMFVDGTIEATKGVKVPVMTTSEINALTLGLGESMDVWHDSNSDGIGDARISWNGSSWRLITETEYNGL
ncbi:MAG: hypothetical protein AB8G11_22405 [Saprospiraceae bacterium]